VTTDTKAAEGTTPAPASGRRIVSRSKESKQFKVYATGKRKTSVARVWLSPGDGTIKVNRRAFEEYFPLEPRRLAVLKPLELANQRASLNVNATVAGGGPTGQAEAIRHGIAKALLELEPEVRPTLKREGLIRRDARIKERKKYGQRGARARFQFSKR
jgi:small subunit ribosomal protein S9